MILGINIYFSKHPHVMMEAILRQPKCEEFFFKKEYFVTFFSFFCCQISRKEFFGGNKSSPYLDSDFSVVAL